MDLLSSPRALRGWTLASVVANMVIIWTGALVRLTKSGLGCSTWPRCEPSSYVPVPEAGIHGVIEFSNRLLTFVLIAIAIGTALSALKHVRAGTMPRRLLGRAILVGLGIIAQAVIGGVSVRLQLNPWVVGLHMVVSVLLIWWCMEMLHMAWRIPPLAVGRRNLAVARMIGFVGIAVILLGVVVTGAGPNAGDGAAQRNGLPLEWAAKTHAWMVWVLVALTVAGLILAKADRRLWRVYVALLLVELVQGAIGYVQYFTHLPIALVLGHMVGTSLFAIALSHLQLLLAPSPVDAAPTAEPAPALQG
ncbi:COX15/CtaA family protein [Nigerium massiliense]|uniref:COX15/CtaA family protein n=1 Tax=Nigerium massiliense TaxID=1522317 RepID=UPI00058D20E1|nr:COX15/CtaA family protein [Nigerium massiliense]